MLGRVIDRAIGTAAILVLAGVGTARAEDPRVEIGASAGWTFSDGVTFDGVLAGDGNVYNSIEPKDAFSYGLNLGFFITPQIEVGGLFSQQKSKLEVGGTSLREIGDQSVDNYHGYFAYNFGDSDAKVRPYVLGGLGVTRYGSVPYSVGSVTGSTDSTSKFSTTWGAGVKIYPGPNVGLKLGVRWTPTYIKSDAEGWWCDPYWGCYVVGDAQYSNQFELTGGIVIRF
jgi:opacity protein-like surface antigen